MLTSAPKIQRVKHFMMKDGSAVKHQTVVTAVDFRFLLGIQDQSLPKLSSSHGDNLWSNVMDNYSKSFISVY